MPEKLTKCPNFTRFLPVKIVFARIWGATAPLTPPSPTPMPDPLAGGEAAYRPSPRTPPPDQPFELRPSPRPRNVDFVPTPPLLCQVLAPKGLVTCRSKDVTGTAAVSRVTSAT